MKISLPINQFFDDQGFPLVGGRISIFRHDSDNLNDIFTLDGDIYRAAVNPIITSEDGRIPTLFFEASVVDVRVEKANGDGTYELVDTFQAGFNVPPVKNDTVINGIDALKDANTEVGVVSVYGYDSDCMAPMRNYVWDPTATEEPDDGVVVLSNTTETGRWILLWDDEKLPCTVYGITPGNEANISSFLGYSDFIGQWNIRTPRIPRFLGGNYTSDTTFSTTKAIYFDEDARFTRAEFVCPLAIIPHNKNYVADFTFNGKHTTAHSSWFRTIDGFWHCDADTLVVDPTNYFSVSQLSYVATLTGKTVLGAGTAIGSYAANAYIQVGQGTSIPDNFFKPADDYVRISGAGFGDYMFRISGTWGPGLISSGLHIQFDYAPDLGNFRSAQRWLSIMIERRNRLSTAVWAETTLDLQGRTVDSAYIGENSFTVIKNANFTGTITMIGYQMSFINVTANITVNSTHNFLLTMERSNISINRYHQGISVIQSRDSDISVIGAEGIDPCQTSLSIYGGSWSGHVKMTTEDRNAYTRNKEIAFRNVFISNNFKWYLNRIVMCGCTSSNPIDLYPYKSGDTYLYECVLENNSFNGAFRLLITYYWDADHPHYEVRGTAVKFLTMYIINNRFDTTDEHGIKMTQWHLGYYEPYMYATYQDMNMGTWRYSGNSGNCPGMAPPRIDNYQNWTHHYEQQLGPHHYYRSNDVYYLFMPWDYEPGGASSNSSPNSMLDPANPNSRVTALIQEENTDGDWADCDVWYANGLSSQADLENEDYNNRFLVYVWLSKPLWSTDTANYNHNGYTTFVRSGS